MIQPHPVDPTPTPLQCSHQGQKIPGPYGLECSLCGVVTETTPLFEIDSPSAENISQLLSLRQQQTNTPVKDNLLRNKSKLGSSIGYFHIQAADFSRGSAIDIGNKQSIRYRHVVRDKRDRYYTKAVWEGETQRTIDWIFSKTHLPSRFQTEVMNMAIRYHRLKTSCFIARKEILVSAFTIIVHESQKIHLYPDRFHAAIIPDYTSLTERLDRAQKAMKDATQMAQARTHYAETKALRDIQAATAALSNARLKARRELFATVKRVKRISGIYTTPTADADALFQHYLTSVNLPLENRRALRYLWEQACTHRQTIPGTNLMEFPEGMRDADVASAIFLIVVQGSKKDPPSEIDGLSATYGFDHFLRVRMVERVKELLGELTLSKAFLGKTKTSFKYSDSP